MKLRATNVLRQVSFSKAQQEFFHSYVIGYVSTVSKQFFSFRPTPFDTGHMSKPNTIF